MTDSTGESNPPKGARANNANGEESILDKMVSGGIKRGLETLVREGRLKTVLNELKLPKEIVAHILSQVDETKHAALGVIGKEIRLFLERTNLSEELAKLLTSLSFEVSTQVRFVPRDKNEKAKKTLKKPGPKSKSRKAPSKKSSNVSVKKN